MRLPFTERIRREPSHLRVNTTSMGLVWIRRHHQIRSKIMQFVAVQKSPSQARAVTLPDAFFPSKHTHTHTGHKLGCLKTRHPSRLGRPQPRPQTEHFLKAWQFRDHCASERTACGSHAFPALECIYLEGTLVERKLSPLLAEVKDDPMLASVGLLR